MVGAYPAWRDGDRAAIMRNFARQRPTVLLFDINWTPCCSMKQPASILWSECSRQIRARRPDRDDIAPASRPRFSRIDPARLIVFNPPGNQRVSQQTSMQ